LKLRVHFDDGSSSDASCRVGGIIRGTDLWFDEGDIVPVRFDPADRSKIEVDVQAIKIEREQKARERRKQAVARAERQLAGSPAPASQEGVHPQSVAAERRDRKKQAQKNKDQQKAFRAVLVEKLERQHEQGLITDEEFAEKKAKVLGH
jgi:translation initiation factor IF-1